MNLAKSMVALYNKYKKPIALLVLIFFGYKIMKHLLHKKEGYSSSNTQQCSTYSNCSECVKNYNAGDQKVPCLWSNDKDKHGNVKGCSSFADPGFYRTCTEPKPTPTKCDTISNCNTCTNSDCFWGDTDQKCSSTFKSGYGKVCSGSNPDPDPNPDPNCPKCEVCPELKLLKIPTFITAQ
jgi:hypothetical protein